MYIRDDRGSFKPYNVMSRSCIQLLTALRRRSEAESGDRSVSHDAEQTEERNFTGGIGMTSLLGQFFNSIRGSQEDIASKGLAYILKESVSAKGVVNKIVKNNTGLQLENIRYITQSVGKNKERPDISGMDDTGAEKIIIETKFWSSLTDNQPVEYLRRLDELSVLIFICPRLRTASLMNEIGIKLRDSNITYDVSDTSIGVDGQKHILVTDWNTILDAVRQSLVQNSEYNLVSDIDQIIGFCQIIDSNTFLPIQDADLSPSVARRINSYYALLDKVIDKLKARIGISTKDLKATGQRFGYTRFFKLNDHTFSLEFNLLHWQNVADTPFWLTIKENWKHQSVDFTNKLKRISLETNIGLHRNNENNSLCFALRPRTDEVEEAVLEDLVEKIVRIVEGL
jgi:hypothetical protein